MYFRFLLFFLLFTSIAGSVVSQGFTISGRVFDAETNEPLQFAHVFIDQTTHGAVTNNNGEFFLENLEAGEYRLVFSFVGFELFNRSVSISDKDMIVNARLVPQNAILQNIEVKGTKDRAWEKNLKDFNRIFLGIDEFAKQCRILNPWVIDFDFDKSTKKLTATTSQPIEIENKALGYLINCSLQNFEFTPETFRIKGLYRFTEMEATHDDEAKRWTYNRSKSYQRSLRFFFKSILDNTHETNGFEVFLDKKPKNYLLNSSYFSNELGERVFKLDLQKFISPYSKPGIFKLMTNDRLEVHHLTSYAQNKTYPDLSSAVSWIEFAKGFVIVSQDGVVVNIDDVTTVGEFNNNRVSSMLPLNYRPGRIVVVNYLTKVNVALRLQERMYAHTDKAFYNPGEKIKFKVYESTANVSVRDSLSGVAYVEVIDQSKRIRLSQKLKLINNEADSEINLPDDWEPGIYYLRIYSNWTRNYGNDNFFMTPICLSPFGIQIFSTRKPKPVGDFMVSLSDRISSMQNLEVTIQLDSASNARWANASISISEAGVATFPFSPDIKQTLAFPKELAADALVQLPYSLEYSMTLNGKFIHPKKKLVSTELTAFRGTMDSVYHIKTDKNGYFKIRDLDFFDSLSFSFQAKNKKGRIFGSTVLVPSTPPDVVLPEINTSALDTVATDLPMKEINKPVVEVKPVERVESEELTTSNAADIIISREMLEQMPAKQSILDLLRSTVPGFQISQSGKIMLKGFNRSSNFEPLIVVDGLPYFQPQAKTTPQQSIPQNTVATQNDQNSRNAPTTNANQSNQNTQGQTVEVQANESVLSSFGYLTSADVSYIEISTRSDPRYGYASVGGVISIFTRKALGNEPNIKTFDVYKLMGYSNTKRDSVDTNNQQSYVLPYWNPSLTLSSAEKSRILLRAPNKPGLYMINIAATSEEGKPLQAYYYFKVD